MVDCVHLDEPPIQREKLVIFPGEWVHHSAVESVKKSVDVVAADGVVVVVVVVDIVDVVVVVVVVVVVDVDDDDDGHVHQVHAALKLFLSVVVLHYVVGHLKLEMCCSSAALAEEPHLMAQSQEQTCHTLREDATPHFLE